jgi:hypothetical protein
MSEISKKKKEKKRGRFKAEHIDLADTPVMFFWRL